MAYKFITPTLRHPSPTAGEYIAEITAIGTKNRDGEKLVSRNGDPKISLALLLVGSDGGLYEMTDYVTLPALDENGQPQSDAGVYLLRKLSEILRALGHDMQAGEGFEINSAAFVNRTAKVRIEIREAAGKMYPEIKSWSLSPRNQQKVSDEIKF